MKIKQTWARGVRHQAIGQKALCSPSPIAHRLSPASAFTMIEIALCLAIIGFALVAIIGVLPAGLNVQRNNREETIISQDATYLMDAIRSGAQGLDDLTNYVYAITNTVTYFRANGLVDNSQGMNGTNIYGFTYTECTRDNTLLSPANVITNGERIIGLLSTPKYVGTSSSPQRPSSSPQRPSSSRFAPAYDPFARRVGFGPFEMNNVAAYVRAISGNATEKPPQNDSRIREIGFGYKLISEITPYSSYDTNWVNYNNPSLAANEITARSNTWLVAKNVNTNLYDLRLRFLWPLLPNGSFGNGRQSYRTMASGILVNTNLPFYHFASRSFAHDTRAQP